MGKKSTIKHFYLLFASPHAIQLPKLNRLIRADETVKSKRRDKAIVFVVERSTYASSFVFDSTMLIYLDCELDYLVTCLEIGIYHLLQY